VQLLVEGKGRRGRRGRRGGRREGGVRASLVAGGDGPTDWMDGCKSVLLRQNATQAKQRWAPSKNGDDKGELGIAVTVAMGFAVDVYINYHGDVAVSVGGGRTREISPRTESAMDVGEWVGAPGEMNPRLALPDDTTLYLVLVYPRKLCVLPSTSYISWTTSHA
jgi:hypothetical protein